MPFLWDFLGALLKFMRRIFITRVKEREAKGSFFSIEIVALKEKQGGKQNIQCEISRRTQTNKKVRLF